VPPQYAAAFPSAGSHLVRYATRLSCVEINSSFYRSHRPATYARWASSVPDHFRFSVKLSREITHARRLRDTGDLLRPFLSEVGWLGGKLGPLLVQLPPSLAFDAVVGGTFFAVLRDRFSGPVACEPRHPSWFDAEADILLQRWHVARVAADPAVVPAAARTGGWAGLAYYRLHGSPHVYYDPYGPDQLDSWKAAMEMALRRGIPAWCIFDNTARGEAAHDALAMAARFAAEPSGA